MGALFSSITASYSSNNDIKLMVFLTELLGLLLLRTLIRFMCVQAMHISVTTLKRLCRRHGVKRWPHRQISGINRALSDLESQHDIAGEGEVGAAIADQLRHLHRRREIVIEVLYDIMLLLLLILLFQDVTVLFCVNTYIRRRCCPRLIKRFA